MEAVSTNIHTSRVYLCQVGPTISCGACCGLYNVADPSHRNLVFLLERRTHWFAQTDRTVAALDAFKRRVEQAEPQERPFPEFHHCAYLGLIDDGGRRVGCLLHPRAQGNRGIDWRGLSYYGGLACRSYFCPSVRQLPARWLKALGRSMEHWYLHGLIVTERRLLTALFNELERRLEAPIDAQLFSQNNAAGRALRALAQLKTDWPFRRKGAPGPCNYFFEDGLYPRPALPAPPPREELPLFEEIFRELESDLSTPDQHQQAIEMVDARLMDLARALEDER